MILEFEVDNDILKKTSTATPQKQSEDYYKCKFFMNKKIWGESSLSVTFTNETGHIKTVQLGEYAEILTCVIPPHIVSDKYFSLYISDDNKKTNTIAITLPKYYKTNKPKCNVISDIYAHIDTKIDDIIYDDYQLKCYSNGKLVNVIYIEKIKEEIVNDAINNALQEFKIQLDEEMKDFLTENDFYLSEEGKLYIR